MRLRPDDRRLASLMWGLIALLGAASTAYGAMIPKTVFIEKFGYAA